MATYVNDLRLKEIATGDESGTWGTSTNTNLELIANAMGLGAETIPNASTHTITMADGTADEFRSTFLRLTGGGTACTVTLAPNTLSHTWIMRNETAAALTLTQGSGANVTIAAGQTKIVATDGGGSGAIVYEMDDLELAGNLAVTGTATADKVTIGTSSASNGKLTLEGVDGADSAGIYFNNTTATNGKSYSLSSGNSGEFMLYDRTSSAYRLFVSSAGKLGLGTTSPAKLLHLSESADGSKLRLTRAGVSEWDFSIGNTSTFTGVGSGALEIIALNGGTAEELAIGRTGVGTPYVHVTSSGVTFSGAISKGSGSFKIDHPLPEKTETHHLVHSFVESPQADNIYRGKVNLVDGLATVNIDDAAGMTEGTYVLLNTNTQCFTSNESGWTAVKGSVSGNILTITAQESCSDTISWMVVGERHDQHMLDTEWTDENGKVIVEPLKQLEE